MDDERLRAWWSHRQSLDGGLKGSTEADVLEETGWARSVGGAGPYLGLFARSGAGRDAVDRAVSRLSIHELPAARGCTYVVPQADFGLALKVGQAFAGADMKTALKLGVTAAEVDRLAQAVLDALAAAPLNPEEIRAAVGGSARSLGEEGRKKGVASTLPLAFGQLQAAGEIRRIAVNGRLDQQRYRYARWHPGPLASFHLSAEDAYTELARRYFRWTAPATLSEFQWFSGLGLKAARAAVAPLALVPLASGSDRLVPPELQEALAKFRPPARPEYVLVSSLDSIILLRRNPGSLMAEEDRNRMLPGADGPAAGGTLSDLPSHAILDRGRLAGLWEYDPDAGAIVWMSFAESSPALREAVARTAEYVRRDLGDARSFSLDSPQSRKPRIEALRALGGKS